MRLFVLMMLALSAVAAEFEKINPEAERLYAEKSFAQAHKLYAAMDIEALKPAEKRWVQFRRADTLWRGAAGEAGEEEGAAALKTAEDTLKALIQGRDRADEQDRVWAEAQESLGLMLIRTSGFIRPLPAFREGGGFDDRRKEGWEHLKNALEWWARSQDIELARRRYIELTWSIFQDPGNHYEAAALAPALENVAKIATDTDNRARAHLILAQMISQRGNANEIERVNAEFEAALAVGKTSQWHDDALSQYAQWLMHSGRVKWDENGNTVAQPNPKKALELLRKLVSEFTESASPHVRRAKMTIPQIEAPMVTVAVSSMFLPNSIVDFNVSFKNARQIEFTLRRVDLQKDFELPDERRRFGNWGAMIRAGAGEVVKRWTRDFSEREEYVTHYESITVDGKLSAGAYLLEASGAGKTAQDLILVTDVAVVANSGSDRTLIFVCNAETGAPIAKASVKFLEAYYEERALKSQTRDAVTADDGLAEFQPTEKGRLVSQAFALVSIDGKPGITAVHPNARHEPQGMWKLYVVTDRPAYRPGEAMRWKVTARRMEKDLYTTPAGAALTYTIHDPRGGKVKEGQLTLNSFGSAWGDLELTSEMALGPYQIVFSDAKQPHIGAGQFRLEEYKLPEFKVTVETPRENGKPKTFRLGEKVEVTVKGEYYFGGGVPNASVHVVVRTNALYHIYRAPRAYPWFFNDEFSPRRHWHGEGEIALEKDLTTDAEGKATFSIETAAFGNEDVEFSIEARMTDASRREIVGSGNIRVTRHRYTVHANAKHWLHRPGDKAEIEFRALDANDSGVAVEGKVKVTRDYWFEIWEDPNGREIKGDELKKLQENKIFPPHPDWRLKFRGYQKEDITSASVKTDGDGKAEFAFTPNKDGYYRVTWLSEDKRADGREGPPVKAETTVWVASNATTELGYRHGDLQIIVDKDTFRAGQKAAVMLHTPANDRWVLLTVVTDRILRREVVHMRGTVKLIELDIAEEHVPNFWVQAVMVKNGQIHRDQKEIIVPPVKNFIEVQVTSEKTEYRVRDQGNYIISARDHEGKPVSAEVEFGVIDEAVFYIQEEYAGDPRQFFFGTKRYQSVSTSSTFDQRAFRKGGQKPEVMERRVTAVAPGEARIETRSGGVMLSKAMAAPMTGLAAADSVSGLADSAPPIIRADFRSTIFWQPDVKTDADGTARVSVKYPDSVTAWKGTARAASTGNQFGVSSAATRTTQPIIVRLQAPRFFVVGDEVTISAIMNNNTSNAVSVTPEIFVEGSKLLSSPKAAAVSVAAMAESRVDWKVAAEKAGEAKIRVAGASSQGSDSMERAFPVHEHGIEKFVSESGKMNSAEAVVKVDLPAARRKDSTRMSIQVTPSLAVTMLDALPYLLDYPYGCTEQTMSRFLPAAIIAKTLTDVGLDAETAMNRVFGGIEAATAAKTQPKGKKNLDQLNDVVRKGMERLIQARHGDGGWGWWSEGPSDPWMTAYVVWGLALAREADLEIEPGMIEGGVEFLNVRLAEAENDLEMQAWMLHAIAAARQDGDATEPQKKALENIWTRREQLRAYSRALFASAIAAFGDQEKAKVLIRNLENGVRRDENSGTSVILKGGANLPTAHWGAVGSWWHWSESPVETTAFALRALLAIDPENKLIDPVANWLIKNRRGAQWSNTRDTAITLLALTDYLKRSGELNPEGEYTISVNGNEIASKKFAANDVFNAPSRFQIEPRHLRDGANEIHVLRKSGQSNLYFAVEATYFSLEEPVQPAANEIFARREYYRLSPKPTLLKGNDYERVRLKEGEPIASGDRLEVSILIESKNNYEYLVFEDLKPGGFEAVQIRSGEGAFARQVKAASAKRGGLLTGDDYAENSRWIYQEMRDRKVATFIDQLPQGFWELRYELRAEAPGKFHALPTLGHAMYVPEIRCNTAEDRVEVRDADKR